MEQKSTIFLLLIFIQQILSACGTDPRIIGGKECDYELHPYAVAIFFGASSHELVYWCGGALISPKWILTTASCIGPVGLIDDITKMIFTTGFNNNKFFQKRHAINAIPHPEFRFRPGDGKYDIGLYLANKPFEQIASLGLAKLPSPGFASKCKTATAIGIGIAIKTNSFSARLHNLIKPSDPLRCVELPIITQDKCSRLMTGAWSRFWYIIDKYIICTLDEKGEKGPCYGDAGNPLLCEGVVIGIHGEIMQCAGKNKPSLYVKVEYFLDFIAKHIHTGNSTGRMLDLDKDGSSTILLSRILLIIVFLLHYIVLNGFLY